MNDKNDKVYKSNLILPLFPVIIVMALILFYWIKIDYDIISISIFILCITSFFYKKGIEIEGNQYIVYKQFFFFKKTTKSEKYEEGIKELFLNRINKEIMLSSSVSGGGRGIPKKVRDYDYSLVINTQSDKELVVLKSKDYSYIENTAKLFSRYYHLPIHEYDINIEYPATGNLIEYEKNPKPIVRRKKIPIEMDL